MNFDIKDVKSWTNRHEVKVGDRGYFSNYISWLQDDVHLVFSKIDFIKDDSIYCFKPESEIICVSEYGFFLPLDKVKKYKPKEKKYRPFKTMEELTQIIFGADWDGRNLQVNDKLYIRYKSKPNITRTTLITNIERDENTKEVFFINNFTPEGMLKNFEFYQNDKWLPFGVEVKEDD